MNADLGLDPLLASLRDAGLRVGVGEVARLQRVFELEPGIGGDGGRLRIESLLRAVLVKSAEDRAVFDGVCEPWLDEVERLEVTPATARRVADAEPVGGLPTPPRRPGKRRRPWRRWLAEALVLAVLGVGSYLLIPQPEPETVLSRPTQPIPGPDVVEDEPTLSHPRERTFKAWVPTLTVLPPDLISTRWLPLSLALLALVTGGGVWWRMKDRRWLPEPEPPPTLKGPPRAYLRPPPLLYPQLLDANEQEALVWGIGRFVAEEPTRKLDLKATVRATARAAGLPRLRFQHASYHREVWLWLDEAAEDPMIERLAAEIAATLEAHGLPVELATFRGLPERLVTATGEVFAPREVDQRRGAALVAVLTDGRLLARYHASDDRRTRVDALLRGLSHWPRLAFVDFSDGGSGLEAILAKHELDLLSPADLSAFLGSSDVPRPAEPVAADASWAAACALAPSSVDEASAYELRQRLYLTTSPWAMRALRAEAPGPPGRLRWPPSARVRRLSWLRDAEAGASGDTGPASLLDRALDFWEKRYDEELKAAEESSSAQHLRMERALVRLWRRPGVAVRELYALYQGSLGDPIRRQLGLLSAADVARSRDRVRLPWARASRTSLERVMLQEMGFGGGTAVESLRRPGRLWLGIGACLGIAAGVLAAALSPVARPALEPTVEHGAGQPADSAEQIRRMSIGDRFHVTVRTRRHVAHVEAEGGSRVRVSWERDDLPCVENYASEAQLWRCGRVATLPPLPKGIRLSSALLAADRVTPAVEDLAMALLDCGSANIVAVVEAVRSEWPSVGGVSIDNPLAHVAKLHGRDMELSPGDQFLGVTTEPNDSWALNLSGFPSGERVVWLRTTESSWSALTAALGFEGTRTVSEVWAGQYDDQLGSPSNLLLKGFDEAGCRPIEETDENGMVFVRVCAGTFLMGSPDAERGRGPNEGPLHLVTLSEFWIGKYEVTNNEYQGLLGKLPSRFVDSNPYLPVENVTWTEANQFCRSLGYRLPTEAEWEYAARAGNTARWSFGDDEIDLEHHAWFESNSKDRPQRSGTRKANPWGLYDMHGNIWEWVADWYGPYSAEPQVDPTGPSDGLYRILRGGAYSGPPGDLRSADRDRGNPEFSNSYTGFRCARGTATQG